MRKLLLATAGVLALGATPLTVQATSAGCSSGSGFECNFDPIFVHDGVADFLEQVVEDLVQELDDANSIPEAIEILSHYAGAAEELLGTTNFFDPTQFGGGALAEEYFACEEADCDDDGPSS